MKRGLISQIDADCIEKTLAAIIKEFPADVINTLELGVCDGDTSRGIHEYIEVVCGKHNVHTGVDSQRDKIINKPFPECNFIISDTIQAHDKIADNSQHFIFQDANHSMFYTVADFLLYRNKVVVGGYYGFHDTSKYIKPFVDYQHIGSTDNPYNYICCREAIEMLGLLSNRFPGWRLMDDVADPNDAAGGVCIFKRIF